MVCPQRSLSEIWTLLFFYFSKGRTGRSLDILSSHPAILKRICRLAENRDRNAFIAFYGTSQSIFALFEKKSASFWRRKKTVARPQNRDSHFSGQRPAKPFQVMQQQTCQNCCKNWIFSSHFAKVSSLEQAREY